MIPLVDLTAQYHSIKTEIDSAVNATLESGHFILGPAVSKFEESVASYLGVKNSIGLASGTDALVLALRSLDIGPGDEVIVPAYTFFATASTVISVGARPVFVDIDPQSYLIDIEKIEEAITPKTRAIVPARNTNEEKPAHSEMSVALVSFPRKTWGPMVMAAWS